MALNTVLQCSQIPNEIVVVDDGSNDSTWKMRQELRTEVPPLAPLQNPGPYGIGNAIVRGLNHMKGDACVIMMADASDFPDDVVNYWRLLNQVWDCVLGSRFIRGRSVVNNPPIKLLINRLATLFIKVRFYIQFNNTTNAFKAYCRTVIDGCRPLIAPHFNILVEIPLKAIVREYSWTVTPIFRQNRKHSNAKLKIIEMGSRYFFICMYVWLEKYFNRADYRKREVNFQSDCTTTSSVAIRR